jgi:hypothetical protein
MTERRQGTDQPARRHQPRRNDESKGQYGGLKGLGPGGGRDIEEAIEPDDSAPEENGPQRK